MVEPVNVHGCAVPDELLYDLEHDVWARPDGEEGTATIGMLSPLASFIGVVQKVEFRRVEGGQARGRSVATVESYRYVGAVRLPVDGTVVERNDEIVRHPKWINDQPYGRGWVARVRAADGASWRSEMESASGVRERIAESIRQRRIHCLPAVPDVELFEIGAECAAVLAALDDTLKRRAPEDVVLLVTDDPTSPIEVVRWSDRTGETLLHYEPEGTLHKFLIRKEANPQPRPRPRPA